MAEAAVASSRFYCHSCSRHFGLSSSDLVCPHCESGFVEEIDSNSIDLTSSDMETDQRPNRSPSQMDLLQGSLTHYWPTMESMTTMDDPGDGISFFSINIQPTRGETSTSSSEQSSSSQTHGARPRIQYNLRSRRTGANRNEATGGNSAMGNNQFVLENLLQQLLSSTSPSSMFGPNATVDGQAGANSPFGMFTLHGNPRDYAWGENGLDNIITQLLGQLDSSGAPPASAESINKLPVCTLTKEQVQAKRDCSICMEAFVADDKAKKLPCSHLFHVPCIEPWLNLHNTCPICRTNIEQSPGCRTDSSTPASTNETGPASGSGASSSGVYYANPRH